MEDIDDSLSPIEPYAQAVLLKFRAFVGASRSHLAYADYLAQTIYYIRQSVPTLLAVAGVTRDPDARKWLVDHAEEESGHDEIFVADLISLGHKLESFPCCIPIRDLVVLERLTPTLTHPFSRLIGDMIVMECFPPTLTGARALLSHYQIEESVAKGILVHCVADMSHSKEVVAWLNSPVVDRSIAFSRAVEVCRLFCRCFDELTARYSAASGSCQALVSSKSADDPLIDRIS